MDKFQHKYRIPSARWQNWDYSSNAAYFITICTNNRECYFGNINNNKMILSRVGVLADVFWHEIKNHANHVELGAFVVMPNHIHGILVLNGNHDNDNDDSIWNGNDMGNGFVDCVIGGDGGYGGGGNNDGGVDGGNNGGNGNGVGNGVHDDDVGGDVIGGDGVGGGINGGLETGHALSLRDPQRDQRDQPNQRDQQDPQDPRDPRDPQRYFQPPPKTPGQQRFRNQGKNTVSSIIGSYKSAVSKHAHRLGFNMQWQPRFHDHVIRDNDEYSRITRYIMNNVTTWPTDKFHHPGSL
jgi:putative transposase